MASTSDDPPAPAETAALVSLLQWYVAMGVDVAVDALPRDRFAESSGAARAKPSRPQAAPPAAEHRDDAAPGDEGGTPPRAQLTQAPPAKAMTAPPAKAIPTPPARATPEARARAAPVQDPTTASAEELAQSARESAAAAHSLDDLRERLLHFEGCGLKATATQLVFADGNPQADIMFVGEAPGADEDRQGLPFVGRAGQLLNKMLAAIDLDRTTVYIANVVPWRPPGNRTPTPLEIAACLPFMRRQIELVQPKILVCLGAPSAQTLLGVSEGIMRVRGRWHKYDLGAKKIPAMAMLHPAYLLRQPAQKKFAWQDLREIAKARAKLGDG